MALIDRRADLWRRFWKGGFMPLVVVFFGGSKPSFSLLSRKGSRRAAKQKLRPIISITETLAKSFVPGLHVFGPEYDPPVAISKRAFLGIPPKGDPATLAVLVPLPGFYVFPVSQTCLANHSGIHLEFGYGVLTTTGEPLRRGSALCVTTFCTEGDHSALSLSQSNSAVGNQYALEVSLLNDPELQNALRLQSPWIVPDRVIPSQNQFVVTDGKTYHYTHYVSVEGGSVMVVLDTPPTREERFAFIQMARDPRAARDCLCKMAAESDDEDTEQSLA